MSTTTATDENNAKINNKNDDQSIAPSDGANDSEPLPEFIDVIKTGGIFEAVAAMFAEYCDCSTIHGVRYLGERKRSWIEKIFWLIIFAISICICCILITDIWKKWNTIPVIISFSDKSTPVWKIPMPTITICPDIKSNGEIFLFSDLENAARENVSVINEWSNTQKNLMDIMLQICEYSKKDFFTFPEKYFRGSFINELENVQPNPNDFFTESKFESNPKNFTEYFDIVLTELGLCFSFNLLPLSQVYRKKIVNNDIFLKPKIDRKTIWTLEHGFEGKAKYEEFPFRAFSSSSENGVMAKISGLKKDIDPICSERDEGFKFAISTPGDIPQLSRQFFSVPFDHEVLVDITPDLITTSDSASDFPPKFRRCFFDSEKYLKFFNIYSQANCEFECLTNYTLQKCGCVRFNMPRTKYTAICGAGSINCYLDAKRELMEKDYRSLFENSTDLKSPDCNCLPSCTSLKYNVGVTQAPLRDLENEFSKTTKFLIYFKESRFWSWERTKLYGIIEFTANAGGLLGLFMGISILSFVELFYFFTVRFLGSLKIRYCSGFGKKRSSKT